MLQLALIVALQTHEPVVINVAGWKVKVNRSFSEEEATKKAILLLRSQLDQIVRVVPKGAVAKLKKVTLYFSPEYPNVRPTAEYHPGAKWLSDNGRNSSMAKGVEFTNIRIFESEVRRMPNFALHELAHAYHDQVLPDGFANSEVRAAYERAKSGGTYEKVERQDSEGKKRLDRAYALTNPQEYFAECTEAYFTRNDFFPFDRTQLKGHDPYMFDLLAKLWASQS
ncbi:MAG: zinc-dependent peptidase [Fimbriimonadaceae bacterium]